MLMRFAPALAAGIVVATACAPAPGPLTQADRDAIQAVSDSFVTLMRAGDREALAALYTDDAVFMPPNQPAVTGREALRQWMAAFPAVTNFSLTNEAVEGRGDLAYVRGRYTMAVEGMPADTGKFIEIRRRGADGVWRLAVDIFNSNQAPAPAAAAPARRR